MKIIGNGSGNKWICEVDPTEVEKYFNLYYNKTGDPLPRGVRDIKIGDEIDLGKAHDFYSATKEALKQTQEFISKHKRVVESIIQGIDIMGKNHEG